MNLYFEKSTSER